MDIDSFREMHMAVAEMMDAWRLAPRALVVGYGYLIYEVVNWYMLLPDPNTQQAALVTTVIGGAAAVFGLYTNGGKNWSEGFKPWKKKEEE